MKNAKVSIITVTYNVAGTIEQTINSVLNQSYQNIEYIVVDGISTDGTWEKICQYKDKISILIHEKDLGLYDAMNKGIKCATGDIIGIINGDDWYEENAIETVVNNFEDCDDILYANLNMWEHNRNVHMFMNKGIDNIWYSMIPHPTVFVKKNVYARWGGFDLNYSIAADYELMLRLYVSGVKFKFIDKILANFRTGGLSTKKIFACAKEVKEISMLYFPMCPDKNKYIKLIEMSYNQGKLGAVYRQDNEIFKRKLNLLFAQEIERVFIFGAGIWGQRCAKKMKECSIICDYFIDNNLEKQGTKINGIEVISPKKLSSMRGYIIIALANGYDEICKQLEEIKNSDLHWIKMFDLCEED